MRNKAIDTVGGIMILFMILRHSLVETVKDTVFGGVIAYYPLLFFMAWFFFKGGMYYREESLATCISKGITRLLVPYVVFSVIAVIVAMIVRGCLSGVSGVLDTLYKIPVYLKREGAVECNAPLWFLLSFFLTRVFFTFSRTIHVPAWCVSVCSGLAAWGLCRAQLPIGLYFGNIAMGLCLFSVGYQLKDHQYRNAWLIPSAVIYVGYLVYCCCTRSVVGIFNNNLHIPFVPTAIYYIAGCIVINNLFTRVPKLQGGFLAEIGYNSMLYYVLHFLIISPALDINHAVFHWSDATMSWVIVLLEIALLPLLVRLFKSPKCQWMVGKGKPLSAGILQNQTVAYVFTVTCIAVMSSYVILKAVVR